MDTLKDTHKQALHDTSNDTVRYVRHISREGADAKKVNQALNWIKEFEGQRRSRDGH